MIKGIHAMFYSPAAEEVRAFIRDKLGLPFTDVGDGWLIFDVPDAEIGCHPASSAQHGISFYCDDIHQTVADLKRRGVQFSSGISDEEWGTVTKFMMPGGSEVELYQPKYKRTAATPKSASSPRQRHRRLRKTPKRPLSRK